MGCKAKAKEKDLGFKAKAKNFGLKTKLKACQGRGLTSLTEVVICKVNMSACHHMSFLGL